MIGDTVEAAIWLDGTETPELHRRFESDLANTVAAFQDAEGVICGPIIWTEKRPGDERVPEVPDHIHGPDVRLLIGEAAIIGNIPVLPPSYFTSDLGPDDLSQLRRITRKSYARLYPRRARLTDRQCDTVINDLGPDAALDALRAGVADIDRVLH